MLTPEIFWKEGINVALDIYSAVLWILRFILIMLAFSNQQLTLAPVFTVNL
jgi:hypothetical protein